MAFQLSSSAGHARLSEDRVSEFGAALSSVGHSAASSQYHDAATSGASEGHGTSSDAVSSSYHDAFSDARSDAYHGSNYAYDGTYPIDNTAMSMTMVGNEAAAPVLPSSLDPLVYAHHDKPVDEIPASAATAPTTHYEPSSQTATLHSDQNKAVHVLDPVGMADVTRRASEFDAKYNAALYEQQHSKDPEAVAEAPTNLSANPFEENKEFNLGMFLGRQRDELDDRGVSLPKMGIAFQDLTVTGYGTGAKLNLSVGSMLTGPARIGTFIKEKMHPHVKYILRDVTGCVKPGEMLLVLGRPGAGCTTFLKSLASYRDSYRSIEGKVLYEGFDHTTIDKTLRGEVIYAPEEDQHFPTLSVKDTLSFAAATRTPRSTHRVTFDGKDSRKGYIEMMCEALATILGLRHTYNTVVGNSFVRGVSGGERKRVSIGEALASRARVVMFDNSSRGLDSSTALEFVQALRSAADTVGTTTFSSMYQASESITNTFDKMIVLNKGHCVYFGPVHCAADYFKSIGFLPHNRQTTADFVVACTDAVARRLNPEFKDVPTSPAAMGAAFRNSEIGQANAREVAEYMAQMEAMSTDEQHAIMHGTRAQRTKRVPKKSMYMLSWPQQVRLAIKRRAQIAWGDRATAIVMSMAMIFQALIMGSVFFQMNDRTNAFFSRSGVIFFALLYNSFSAMAEVPNNYEQRPIVIRHKRFAMLRPSADALANVLLDIPVRMLPMTLFNVILYFMTGLSYDAGKFFIFYFLVLLITFTMVSFFRVLTAMFRAVAMATMIAGLVVIDCALYAGYAIPRPSMVVWWRWLSYCNPISFGFEVLLTNEFRNKSLRCSQMIPPGADTANQVCPVAGAKPGQLMIDGLDYLDSTYGYSWKNTDRNVGIVIGFFVFFVLAYMIASEFQTDPAASAGVMVYKRGKVSRQMLASLGEDPEEALMSDEKIQERHEGDGENFNGMLEVSDEIFSWKDINYDVLIKGKPRRLLNNVSGYVAPGKMTALMGESGAGKTTLLNVLAQRTDVGVVRGDFFVDGNPLPKSFQADTGYCQQQDVHLAQQTVREALQFSAFLRQPRETPKAERLAYVETVIELLEMDSFADALVGGEGEGLNVEQRKRLTIGVELAAKPKLLLFLDEPTSGLDAQAAWSIVRFLKKLAAEGQAILCTIHQPSGELFNQFDRLLLLQKGGKTVYFGDIGENSRTLLEYFENRSGVKCDENANPAEYILDVIGAGATATTDKDWYNLFRQSDNFHELQSELNQISKRRERVRSVQPEHQSRLNREYAQPFSVQLRAAVGRMFLSYWRNPTYVTSKLFLNLFGGLFIGSSFWGQGQKISQAALQNKLFATFMSLVISTSLSQQLQPEFITQRNLFEVRERPSKLYSWPVFMIAQMVVEAPWNIIGGTLFWIPWYFMVQFGNEGPRAGYSWGLYMIFQLYYATFAQAVAAISPNALIASVLFSTFFSFVIVFCGVVQPPAQLPYFWRSWMFHLSPFTYLVEGMLGNAIHDKPVRCLPNEFKQVIPPSGMSCDQFMGQFTSTLQQPAMQGRGYYEVGPNGSCNFCSMREGEDYIRSILLSSSERFRDIGLLCAYTAFNVLLAFALYYLFRVHKWKKAKAASEPKPEDNVSDEKDGITPAEAAQVSQPSIVPEATYAAHGAQVSHAPTMGAPSGASAEAEKPTSQQYSAMGHDSQGMAMGETLVS